MEIFKDRNGKEVRIGSRVRVIALSGRWIDVLPRQEKQDILSMIGETFLVDSLDSNGSPCVSRTWPEVDGFRSHDVVLASHEIEVVYG
jgi:hypothetical protein